MKQGKVFEKLAKHSKVETINFFEDTALVILKTGFYNGDDNKKSVKNAREAALFIRGAEKKEARPGFVLVNNMMTGKLVEIEKGTPSYCDPSQERYWTM